MLERWTIDSVAAEIEAQFEGADPAPKLLYRFYREGVRHGKRGMAASHMRDFIVNVVELAAEHIASDYLDEEQTNTKQFAAMKARKQMLEEDIDELEDNLGGEGSDGAATTPSSGLGPKANGPDLSGAVQALKAERAAMARQARAAKAETELDGIERELDDLGERIAVTEQALAELPEKFRQLVESCHKTGDLLWTRYRLGYLRGNARRGSPDENDETPDAEIEFDYPNVLEA